MPCSLQTSEIPGIDFEGPAGVSVTLTMTSDTGAAKIMSALHNGGDVAFTVSSISLSSLIKGQNTLTLTVETPNPDDEVLHFCEKCDGGACIDIPYNDPGVTIVIEAK